MTGIGYDDIIQWIRSNYSKRNVEGQARFGITPKVETYGTSVKDIRKKAKETGRDHRLAQRLWGSGIHDARMLAVFVEEPDRVTEDQMDRWVYDFDSWDITDQCCSQLFDRTAFVDKKIKEWSRSEEEFVKRAGIVLIAARAVHDKKAPDGYFIKLLPILKREAKDERNFVKKAVNWSLRSIGKRNMALNKAAIALSEDLKRTNSRSARWIASDALRELRGEVTLRRIRDREAKLKGNGNR